jgi:phosphate transport system ATP-binding protein
MVTDSSPYRRRDKTMTRQKNDSGVIADKMRSHQLRAWFGSTLSLKGITLPIKEKRVTAVIGPSGCGKSTFVRCLNRMHEVVAGSRAEGTVLLDNENIYGRGVDPVQVRRRVVMVFQ